MGWAKYTEDDLEIMQNRQYMRQQETIITVTQKTLIIPFTTVKIKVENRIRKSPESGSTSTLEDRKIQCKDCGRIFSFSTEAQEQYKKMAWCAPKRCKACRERRRVKQLMCS